MKLIIRTENQLNFDWFVKGIKNEFDCSFRKIPTPGDPEFLNLPEKLKNILRLDKPDLIINCSSNQLLTENKKSILNLLNSNVYSNIFFLNEAINYKNFKGYITFGTKFEFDAKRNYKPLNFYAATKHANDLFLEYYSLKKKITKKNI